MDRAATARADDVGGDGDTGPESWIVLPRATRPRRWRPVLSGGLPVALLAVVAIAAPWLAPLPPERIVDPVAARELPPGARLAEVSPTGGQPPRDLVFRLGTDHLGRDVLSRLLHGARISLAIGGGSALMATLLGVGVGMLAAAGGLARRLVSPLTTAFLSFPRLFLVVALAAFLPPGAWTVALILAGTGWMGLARVVEGELRGLLQQPFVQAARGAGIPPTRLLYRHLLPHLLTPVAVLATTMVGEAILAEAALSYLGLGVPPPTPSWGVMAADATTSLGTAWWAAAAPGLALSIAALGFQLLGDGLRDALAVPGT